MLSNTGPIEPQNIHHGRWRASFSLFPEVHKSSTSGKPRVQNGEVPRGNKACQACNARFVPSGKSIDIMLNIVSIKMVAEAGEDVFVDVELLDEFAEYGNLFFRARRSGWAVTCSRSEREEREEYAELHREVI